MNKPLLIGQLAKLAGVKPDSVRFYERSGLLPKAERTQSGYRVYDEAALKQLRFIKQAQALGFTLDEIKGVLRMRDSGRAPCGRVIEVAAHRLREVERKLAEWRAFRDVLRGYLRRWKREANSGMCAAADFCNLIEAIEVDFSNPVARPSETVKTRGKLK